MLCFSFFYSLKGDKNMNNQNLLQELLKQYSLGKGVVNPISEDQKYLFTNKQPNKRKNKGKLKLGLIKG